MPAKRSGHFRGISGSGFRRRFRLERHHTSVCNVRGGDEDANECAIAGAIGLTYYHLTVELVA